MNWQIVLFFLTIIVVLMSASYTMLVPFLPLYLTHELGVTSDSVNLWSSFVFSASFLVSAVVAPIWGRIADTKGTKLMAIRSSLCLSIGYFLEGIVQSPEQLVAARAFHGFSAGLWPISMTIMTLYAPVDKLGISLGIMQGARTAGGMIGPMLGGVLAESFGMRMSFYLASIALFTICLIYIFIIKEPKRKHLQEPPKQKEKKPKSLNPFASFALLKKPVLTILLLCGAFVQMVMMILQPVLTTYIASFHEHVENIILVSGVIFSLGGIAGALGSPVWGWLGQRKGFFKMLLVALFLSGVAMIAQGIVTDLYSFAALQFIAGIFLCGILPSMNALLARNSEPEVKGQVFGLLFTAQQIGSIVGPVLGGVIATYLGMHFIFYVSGVFLLFLPFYLKYQFKRLQAQ